MHNIEKVIVIIIIAKLGQRLTPASPNLQHPCQVSWCMYNRYGVMWPPSVLKKNGGCRLNASHFQTLYLWVICLNSLHHYNYYSFLNYVLSISVQENMPWLHISKCWSMFIQNDFWTSQCVFQNLITCMGFNGNISKCSMLKHLFSWILIYTFAYSD